VAQEVRLKDLFQLIMELDPIIRMRSPVPCAWDWVLRPLFDIPYPFGFSMDFHHTQTMITAQALYLVPI